MLVFWLLLWQVGAHLWAHPYFPDPARIAQSAAELWLSGPPSHLWLSNQVTHDIAASVIRLLGGWGAAVLLGTAVGIGLGRSARAWDYLRWPLTLARAVPQPLLVPLFLVVLGLGPTMQIASIVLGAIWPVLLNAVDGARAVEPQLADTMRVARVGRVRWVLRIVLPAASPRIFAGLRISLSVALILMVVSELVGSTEGIGYRLAIARATSDFPAMWAWICLLGALGSSLNLLLLVAQRRVLAWHPRLGRGR